MERELNKDKRLKVVVNPFQNPTPKKMEIKKEYVKDLKENAEEDLKPRESLLTPPVM